MKYVFVGRIFFGGMSPPSRGAWIEILVVLLVSLAVCVAPLAGGVD